MSSSSYRLTKEGLVEEICGVRAQLIDRHDRLGVLHDGSRVIHHGRAADVRAYERRFRGALGPIRIHVHEDLREQMKRGSEALERTLTLVEIPVSAIDEETLEIFNRCLSEWECGGVGEGLARLSEAAETADWR